MSKTKIMMIALVPSLLFICLYVLLFYDPFSNCPMAFRFEFETKCWLKDERVGVKLIELYNADTNGFWLAKVAERVVWLEHPHDHMSSYKKHIPENRIKFLDDELNVLIINEENFTPKVFLSRPIP